jgi:hypothetical protein
MAKISKTHVPVPHTRAWLTFEENLESIGHMLTMSGREADALKAQATRLRTFTATLSGKSLLTKPARAKVVRWLNRIVRTLKTSGDRMQTITRWQVVMMVTCIEAYLQDVLSTAASLDPELMKNSEQRAQYADVIAATSLDALADKLRARWARNWLSDGGPTRWISRFRKMGVTGYSDDLASRLERYWGIRHVVVHAAGVATPDFVKRHPGAVAAAGDRVRVSHRDLKKFFEAVWEFMGPTENFFLARYPAMIAAASTQPNK